MIDKFICPTCLNDLFTTVSTIELDKKGRAAQVIEEGFRCVHCSTRVHISNVREITVDAAAAEAAVKPLANRVRSSVSAGDRGIGEPIDPMRRV